jgi:competence protein ComFC
MWLNRVKKFFLDLFFPKKCLGCGQADIYLCPACFNKIEILLNNECFFCGKITWQGKICFECKKENYLDRIISATNYGNPLIRESTKAFKYHFVKELVIPLSQILIKSLDSLELEFACPPVGRGFIMVPVPLYKAKLRSRGFNQAELLAKEISNYFNIPTETDIIKRKFPGMPQANIKDTEKRKKNIKEAFEISEPEKIIDKTIILIDDVITTGATLIEIAKILKQNSVREIWAITVAKG